MKRIVIAPDSFKGCLDAAAVASAMASGVLSVLPDAECLTIPLADGGEGTLEALLRTPGAVAETAAVHDAFMRPAAARIAGLSGGGFAVELAEVCGIERHRNELDAKRASSFGLGEAILAAHEKGAKHIVVALGGSCSTDGGAGMLQALGAIFTDRTGRRMPDGIGGGALPQIAAIDVSHLPALKITIATDVTSPLTGPDGAAFVFSPQKGASGKEVVMLDNGLRHFAELAADPGDAPGDGAAGGVAFALRRFMNGSTVSGGKMVMELAGLERALENADWLLTGEGRSDAQTAAGKICFLAAQTAEKHGVPTALLSGAIRDRAVLTPFFARMISVSPPEVALDDAIKNAAGYLKSAAASLFA
ncbi:MAG: glycerate kinase [Victivallaceae bacterium]|nr:glycerate kinase [Victivallaceae bacterium]